MLRVLKVLAMLAVVGAFVLPSIARVDAQVSAPNPFFTTIRSCGTVGLVPSTIDNDGNGQLDDECKVWIADAGGAFIVAGIDNKPVGERVFVTGKVCNICLTTCMAGAIFDAKLGMCPPKHTK
jgi:hypothetical protein